MRGLTTFFYEVWFWIYCNYVIVLRTMKYTLFSLKNAL